jgi:hypothetical protein
VTLEQMLDVAKVGGSVRWADGAVTKVTLEDSHLFGMVLCKWGPEGAEPLRPENTYDAEPVPGADGGSGKDPT